MQNSSCTTYAPMRRVSRLHILRVTFKHALRRARAKGLVPDALEIVDQSRAGLSASILEAKTPYNGTAPCHLSTGTLLCPADFELHESMIDTTDRPARNPSLSLFLSFFPPDCPTLLHLLALSDIARSSCSSSFHSSSLSSSLQSPSGPTALSRLSLSRVSPGLILALMDRMW